MKVGSFTERYEIDGSIFYVRGLTVGEHTQIAMLDGGRGFTNPLKPHTAVEIAFAGIVGWENIYNYQTNEPVEFNEQNLEALPEDVLTELGDHIFFKLTHIDDQTEEKLRGYTRFAHFMSKKENRVKSKTFNCKNCIERGHYRSRVCGKYDQEDLDEMHAEMNDKEVETSTKNIKSKLDKYRSRRRRTMKLRKNTKNFKQKKETLRQTLTIKGFKFPECPISWVDNWIQTIGGVLFHSDSSDLLLFQGGLFDQPYKLYQASRIISSESNKIEREEWDEKNRK